jgi:hypothetical protein
MQAVVAVVADERRILGFQIDDIPQFSLADMD